MSSIQNSTHKETSVDRFKLPDEWPEDVTGHIQRQVASWGGTVVVLDDDPTGTQTVHGVPVLTHWSVPDLAAELQGTHRLFYLLTNSRSMTDRDACLLNHDIGANLREAAQISDIPIAVISRSDSTLRGHFPSEVDALADAMGLQDLPYIIIPCFFEGGRYTIHDVHYVAENEKLIPVAQTSYAKDAAFGFKHSNLRQWVEEKTAGRIRQESVISVSIEDLRIGGPDRVNQILKRLPAGSACVVNAASYWDLEVFSLGLLHAEMQGAKFLFRTAASFVRTRCGISPRELLGEDDIVAEKRTGGLFIVGSYVPKTTEQIELLKDQKNLVSVKIETERLLREASQRQEIDRVADLMNQTLGAGQDVLIYTSRKLISGNGPEGSLEIGRRVSNSLVQIVQALQCQPRYLVAKGGITSSDVATKGLGVRRAMVLGQILPGVPVWRLGSETRYSGMAYIVFPGNVGAPNALASLQSQLMRLESNLNGRR